MDGVETQNFKSFGAVMNSVINPSEQGLNYPQDEKEKLDLSIIIVNYKAEGFLRDCLDSIYAQKTNLRFEIWLINNSPKEFEEVCLNWFRETL